MAPTGLQPTFVPTIEEALREALRIIRNSAKRVDMSARNARIIARYKAGETLQELANVFEISFQRIHQIIQEGN